MNTSENKNRVAEQGWIYILKNSIPRVNISLPCMGDNNVQPFRRIDDNTKDDNYIVSGDIKPRSSSNAILPLPKGTTSAGNVSTIRDETPYTSKLFKVKQHHHTHSRLFPAVSTDSTTRKEKVLDRRKTFVVEAQIHNHPKNVGDGPCNTILQTIT